MENYKLYRTDDLKEFETLDEALKYADKNECNEIVESLFEDEDVKTRKCWTRVLESKDDLNNSLYKLNAKIKNNNKKPKVRYVGNEDKEIEFFNKGAGEITGQNGGEGVACSEGAEGKKEPGYEYVIYKQNDEEEKAPIIAKRSTRVEAEYFINNREDSIECNYERVPKGKFNVGDDFYGPFDKDYNRM